MDSWYERSQAPPPQETLGVPSHSLGILSRLGAVQTPVSPSTSSFGCLGIKGRSPIDDVIDHDAFRRHDAT